MTTELPDTNVALRRSIYMLLIVLSTGAMLGRIAAVQSVDTLTLQRVRLEQIPAALEEKRARLVGDEWTPDRVEREMAATESRLREAARLNRPGLSANDRSRWCTLRALVEKDMRVSRPITIGGKPYRQPVLYAIDKVQNEKGWDTIDMVKHGLPSDESGTEYLFSSKPPLLPTLMAGPYWLIHKTTGATLGTHPFAVARTILVLVNVIPLVFCMILLSRVVERFGTTDWGRCFVMGAAAFGTFLTTFAVTLNNHIPGTVSVFIALYAAIRIWIDGRRELRYFVIAGLFAAFSVACELPALAFFAALFVGLAWKAPRQTLLAYVPAAVVVAVGFFGTNWVAHESLRPPYAHREEGANWYDYSYERGGRERDSYWRNRIGIDRGEPSRAMYVVHALVGHHGVFSLTPIWLLAVGGVMIWLVRPNDPRLRELAFLIGSVSAVCLLFYLSRPQDDRNYGGMTSGFRWMFWFAPMWLVTMLPAVDRMSKSRTARGIALVLLALSVLSASYPTWNPWIHPWAVNLLHSFSTGG